MGLPKNKIDVLHEIDSNDKAYWLAFLGADGCNKQRLRLNKNGKYYPAYEVEFRLAKKDKEQVLNFREFLGSSNKVSFVERSKNGYEGGTGSWKFTTGGKMLSKDLVKNGCPPRKSKTYKFPTEKQVPNKFLNHTVRGYFDGDGSIFNYPKSNHNVWSIGITGTESYIKTLDKKLKEALPELVTNVQKEKRVKHRMLNLMVSNRKSLLMFLKWMYKGSTEKTRLPRKYEKAMSAIKELEENSRKLKEFENLKLIIRSPEGKIFEVTEKEWPSFAVKIIFRGDGSRTNKYKFKALRSGRTKKTGSTDGHRNGWEILNIEEAKERKYPRGWMRME